MEIQHVWEILELKNDMEQAQMLFAKIENYAIGAIEDHGIMKIFIKDRHKDKIIRVINESNWIFDLKWDSIDNEDWHLMWKDNF